MNESIAIFCRLTIAVLTATLFTFLKRLVDRRRPSLEDSSDVAWVLILISIGFVTGYSKEWTAAHFATTIVWDILFASILLFNRSRKVQAGTRSVAAGSPAPSIGIVEACAELLVGMACVVMTIR